MKRRFTFFSRLAAGLLTVLLALPQSAWAEHIVRDPYEATVSLFDEIGTMGTSQWDLDDISTSNLNVVAPIYKRSKVTSKDYAQGYYYRGYVFWDLPIGSGTATVKQYYSMKDYTDNTYEETRIYTVEKGEPTMFFYTGEPYNERWGKLVENKFTSKKIYVGDTFEAPELMLKIKNKLQVHPNDTSNVLFETADIAADYQKILYILDTISLDYGVEFFLNFTDSLVTTDITYESSDPTIATVDATTGAVTPLKAGEVTITAKWAGNDKWKAAETSYTLTIQKNYAYVYFSEYSLTITEGDTFTEPEATTDPAGLPLTYSSNNEAVATVDATTGKLTIVGAGDATITATFAGNDEYREASRSYTLTVNERPKEYVSLSFDGWLELEIGQTDIKEPTLNNPQGVSPIVWSSDDESVVTVNQNGKLTIVGLGRTFINATFEGNATYYPASVSYAVSVLMPCDERYFVDAEGNRIDTLEMSEGETVNLPSLYDPAAKTTVAINSVYGEKYGDMVTITDKTSDGYVFGIYGYESAVVEFMAAVWDEAKNRDCSYPIVVRIIGKAESGLSFSTDYAEGYVGKAFKAPVLNNPNKLSPIVWKSSNTEVATVSEGEVTLLAAGKTVISASYAGDDTYREGSASYSLNVIEGCPDREFRDKDGHALDTLVVTVGDSLIVGKDIQLYDLASAEYVDPTYADINSTDHKIIGLYKEWTYLSKYDSIATLYFVAKAEGEAYAQVKTYEKQWCTYDLYVVVKPVIVPVPDDEETTFDFSVIGPDGSDMLSVSLGANDSYNEEEGRLEIASTATEEDVTAALEAAVPGSSAFMSLLPSSISFEVEEGEGDIEIDCQTLPGFVLKVRINGVGEAFLSQTVEQHTRSKATVHYNVSQKTYVVIYLQGAPSSPAPARIIAATADDDPNAGAYIYGIKVTPKKSPSAVENVQRDNVPSTKVLIDGVLYIVRPDGKVFNAQGVCVK